MVSLLLRMLFVCGLILGGSAHAVAGVHAAKSHAIHAHAQAASAALPCHHPGHDGAPMHSGSSASSAQMAQTAAQSEDLPSAAKPFKCCESGACHCVSTPSLAVAIVSLPAVPGPVETLPAAPKPAYLSPALPRLIRPPIA